MKFKAILTTILMSVATFSGLGALPSKPDFAYPKTVSKNASKELKDAIKKQDGPAAVRALLDYGLAQTAINPDKFDATMEYFSEVGEKLDSPAAKAMIMLARGDARHNDSLICEAITRYGNVLKETPTADWRNVVNADPLFFPTLYDFAVAQTETDSIINAAMAYDAARPYPLIYLQMRRRSGFDEFKSLYLSRLNDPVDVYPMTAMVSAAYSLQERKEAYRLIKDRDGKEYAEAVKALTAPSITCRANTVVARGKKLKVSVSAVCLNSARLKVEMIKPTVKTVKTVDLTFAGSGVFESDTVVELSFDNYGVYKITPVYEGLHVKRPDRMEVTVTDFLLSKPVYGGKSFKPMALDAINGALQSDVKFTTVKNRLSGSRGADVYSPTLYSGRDYEPENNPRKSGNLLTDRSIYHPGDTLRFAATLMEARGMTRKLLAGTGVKVTLKNVNWQDVDSQTLTSDDFGRIHGEFLLPKDGLTGRYMIELDDFGRQSIMVTDYKAPTFAVELKAERVDSATVELRGSAMGYNGFPIADAQVALTVNELPIWVWFRSFRNFRNNDIVATDTVQTDADGRFTAKITIPRGVNLSATATVTSLAGESRDDMAFIPFNRYYIEGSAGQYVEAGKGPKFRVVDADGLTAADVAVKVVLNDSIVPDSAWSNVPSGAYSVKVTAEGAAMQKFDTQVYRRDDKMPPAEHALFVPVATAKPGDKLLVGTSFADSHILLTVWTPDSIIEQRWLTPDCGNFFLDTELPKHVDDARMTLMTLRNYRFEEKTVMISRPDVARSLKLEISSLRDRMTPGEREVWTVKVTDNLGKPVHAAVMADAYCKALDALQPFNWSFMPPYLSGRELGFRNVGGYLSGATNSTHVGLRSPLSGVRCSFNLRDRSWPYTYVRNYYAIADNVAPRRAMKMAALTSMDDAVKEEAAVEMEMDAGAMLAGAAAGVETTDSAAPDEAPASDSYRMPEVAVALWQPILTTDADGSLQIEFVAPDANTTWAVHALAYNKELLSGTAGAEIVTSKPVMVQPQLPRFLRVGDKIRLRAMVMNNTDSAAAVSSYIEMFDPATDAVIARREFSSELDAKASDVIALDFVAPDAAMVGIRTRATAGNFTDGEQAIIAILPNRVDVRTGRPLFLPSDSAAVEVDVPRGGVLTFTANAVWECVTALPGLRSTQSRSALSAASALFSAATARGLMLEHPEIGRALHVWEQEDSVLISRLMKNDDLKMALLESTPFVQAAQNETDRRARLLILFNNKEIEKTINASVSTLQMLMRDGGLAWTQNCDEPSVWITRSVLSTLAQLKRLGYMPKSKELDRIITRSVEYLDKEVASEFAKNKKARFVDYVMLRSQFPEVRQSAPARRAAEATVQYLVGHWRDLSLLGVAEAAIILNENNYPTTAHKLIESLRQHEAWAQLPLSPVLLEAFARVEPTCPEVDMIRNNYVSRKQSMDWGSGMEVSNLVAAILNSGAKWLVPAANQLAVKVNGEPVELQPETMSGEFRLNLADGGNVEINKGNFPAWGGIYSASVDSITKVEPFSSDKLKLRRTITGKPAIGEKVTVTLTIEASQDIDYVVVSQPHCAGIEVVDQIPAPLWLGRLTAYREPTATSTNWYFNRLVKGKTVISETFYVTAEGDFILAPAEVQSLYAPEFQSHTSGSSICIPQK